MRGAFVPSAPAFASFGLGGTYTGRHYALHYITLVLHISRLLLPSSTPHADPAPT
jgi:hypothetical protein